MKIFITIICLLTLAIVCVMACVFERFITARRFINEKPIRQYYDEVRQRENYCKLEDISINLRCVIVYMEDMEFYKHHGYRLRSIIYALYKNICARKIVMGGSTITQQLAKNIYFSFTKHLRRKAAELFVAIHIEKELTKDEIFELYLNIIYYGMDKYGIVDACRYYFDKNPCDVSLNEAVTIGCLLPAPTNYNPCNPNGHFDKAKKAALPKLVHTWFLNEEQMNLLMQQEYNKELDVDINMQEVERRLRDIKLLKK